jgi:hypothetical protein
MNALALVEYVIFAPTPHPHTQPPPTHSAILGLASCTAVVCIALFLIRTVVIYTATLSKCWSAQWVGHVSALYAQNYPAYYLAG